MSNNILIINNGNLPLNVPKDSDNLTFINYPISFDSYADEAFDTYVSSTLKEAFENEKFDLIILPYSLTQQPIEYTGLRVAAHIRLTDEWHHKFSPILFLGPDTANDVILLSSLGGMLFSFNIYHHDQHSDEDIYKKAEEIIQDCQKNNSTEDVNYAYSDFLNRIKTIETPANYCTHHSIANEWAIMRWIDMITWDNDYPQPEILHNNFSNMLYFKYLMAVAGDRESFSRKYKKNNPLCPKIDGIANNRIVCIDDESIKGWKVLLESIFKASGAEIIFFPFDESTKSITKDKLIDNIKDFLLSDYQLYGGADCYIIDLRLHDDDFDENIKYHELSGHKIAEFIKSEELNPHNQVIIFTASNKVWNYEKAVKQTKACGYVIKESPEQNLSKSDSRALFYQFTKSIKHACNMSYLRDLYGSLKNLEIDYEYAEDELLLLYQFVELLNIDNNQKQESLIRACTLTLYAFFESFMDNRFIPGTTDFSRKDCDCRIMWSGKFYVKYVKNDKNEKIITDIKTVNENSVSKDLIGWDKWMHDKDKINIAKNKTILIPLSLYYNISDVRLRKVLKLINVRNSMAHKGIGEYTLEDLKEIFNDIILPIVRQDARCKRWKMNL